MDSTASYVVILLLSLGMLKAFVQGKVVVGSAWILCGCVVAHLLASIGSLCVPVSLALQREPKVFAVGLSRTGTTSITQALTTLGYHPYHSLGPLLVWKEHRLVGFDQYWVDAYDAHTDLPTALVFQELAVAYPSAKFVLTKREPERWAAAMMSFSKEVSSLFHLTQMFYDWSVPMLNMQPADDLFVEAYGPWRNNSLEDWVAIYNKHEKAVLDCFEGSEGDRFLAIDITKGDITLKRLADFIGIPLPSGVGREELLPKADVFDYTFTVQPIQQFQNLLDYLVS